MKKYSHDYDQTALVGESAELEALEEFARTGLCGCDVTLDVTYSFRDNTISRRFFPVTIDYDEGAVWIREFIEAFYRQDVVPAAMEKGETPCPDDVKYRIYFPGDQVPELC